MERTRSCIEQVDFGLCQAAVRWEIHIGSPYQAKDGIKNLDGIGQAAVVLDDAGFSVVATKEMGEALEMVVN